MPFVLGVCIYTYTSQPEPNKRGLYFTVYVVCNKDLTIAVFKFLLYYWLSLNLADTLLFSTSSLAITMSFGASIPILIRLLTFLFARQSNSFTLW